MRQRTAGRSRDQRDDTVVTAVASFASLVEEKGASASGECLNSKSSTSTPIRQLRTLSRPRARPVESVAYPPTYRPGIWRPILAIMALKELRGQLSPPAYFSSVRGTISDGLMPLRLPSGWDDVFENKAFFWLLGPFSSHSTASPCIIQVLFIWGVYSLF